MHQWLILIHEVCRTFPQYWDELTPYVEFLLANQIGECGFSPHELETGYALLHEPDVTMLPLQIPRGLPQTDLLVRLFTNFKELAGILNRAKEGKLEQQMKWANETRHLRRLDEGEIVFRRMPPKARTPKHLLAKPSAGPYRVVGQATLSSAKLIDPNTGQLVDEGADIPLEQILVGPKRSNIKFEPSEKGASMTIGSQSSRSPEAEPKR